MDPDQALENARAALRAYHKACTATSPNGLLHAGAQVVYALEALDGWLSKGGVLPKAWDHQR